TTFTGPTVAVRGQPRRFTVTATDISPAYQARPFLFDFDWNGDGVWEETGRRLSSGASFDHLFPDAGVFRVQARASDGADSGPTRQLTVTVSVAKEMADDLYSLPGQPPR